MSDFCEKSILQQTKIIFDWDWVDDQPRSSIPAARRWPALELEWNHWNHWNGICNGTIIKIQQEREFFFLLLLVTSSQAWKLRYAETSIWPPNIPDICHFYTIRSLGIFFILGWKFYTKNISSVSDNYQVCHQATHWLGWSVELLA